MFQQRIAEEWLTEGIGVFNFMSEQLGYDRLQMGGQGGIVANALAVCGVGQVFCHCNSLPELQARQFLPLDNLLSFDENGAVKAAHQINRTADTPLIHWIIEFDKGDVFELDGHKVSCPKANRFIATYDPLNLRLVMDENFVDYVARQKLDAVILSGYHALTAANGGVELIEGSVPVVQRWQDRGALLHLEVASTQDKIVRKAIVEKVASRADSIGLNERETIDVLEVINEENLAKICEEDCTAVNLFDALLRIKKKSAAGESKCICSGCMSRCKTRIFRSARKPTAGECVWRQQLLPAKRAAAISMRLKTCCGQKEWIPARWGWTS